MELGSSARMRHKLSPLGVQTAREFAKLYTTRTKGVKRKMDGETQWYRRIVVYSYVYANAISTTPLIDFHHIATV